MGDWPRHLLIIPQNTEPAVAAVHRRGLVDSSHYPHGQSCRVLPATNGLQAHDQGYRSHKSRRSGVGSRNCNRLARYPGRIRYAL